MFQRSVGAAPTPGRLADPASPLLGLLVGAKLGSPNAVSGTASVRSRIVRSRRTVQSSGTVALGTAKRRQGLDLAELSLRPKCSPFSLVHGARKTHCDP